jgi:hypothetical protein
MNDLAFGHFKEGTKFLAQIVHFEGIALPIEVETSLKTH